MSPLLWRASIVMGLGMTPLMAEEWQLGRFTVLSDFVYMERDHVQNRPIALDSGVLGCRHGCHSNRVMDTKDLVHGYKPGMQVSLLYRHNVQSAYELSGLYLWQMDNTRTKYAVGDLAVPFQDPLFASSYFHLQKVFSRYQSLFYTGELNYWRTFSETRHSTLSLEGVFGLRFMNLSEHFTIDAYKQATKSSYLLSAKNDFLGCQVGLDFGLHLLRRFYWNLQLKGGVGLNKIHSKVFLGNQGNQEILRNYVANPIQAGTFVEALGGAGCQLLDWLDLHVGYRALFFGGLALAPDQLNYTSNRLPATQTVSSFSVKKEGYVMVQGLYAGLSWSF